MSIFGGIILILIFLLKNVFLSTFLFFQGKVIKIITSSFSKQFSYKAHKAEDFLKNMVTGGTLFSELGFYYIGPIDGHDLDNLIPILNNTKNSKYIIYSQNYILINYIYKIHLIYYKHIKILL